MSSQIFTKPLPIIALIIAHAIWGANFVVAKVTLQEFPIYSLAFLRFALACVLIFPFFVVETRKFKLDLKDLPKLIGVGLLIITFNIAFFFLGIEKTSAISASALTLVIPIISVVVGWIYLKEKIYFINLLGIILGLIGALLIVGITDIILGNVTVQALIGNFFIILASFVFVGGAALSRPLLKKYPSLVVTGIAFLVGALTFFIPAVFEYLANPGWINKVSILGILGLTYMTLLSSISAYFLFEWGLAKTSLSNADLFQYIEPFIAAGLAVLILGERVSFSFLIGAILISLGVYWGTLSKERHHRYAKTHRV